MIKRGAARVIAAMLLGVFCTAQPAAAQSTVVQRAETQPTAAQPTAAQPTAAQPTGARNPAVQAVVGSTGRHDGAADEPGPAGPVAAALRRYELGEDGSLRYRLLSDPEPYRPEEFPQFALSLRRFQIVTIGVFPFALLFSGLGYELGRFGYYSLRAGEPDGRYTPRLFGFGAGAEEPLSNRERIGVVTAAVSLSVFVGVLDYLLGRRERAAEPDDTW